VFGRRPDAEPVRDLAPVRRFMPFISLRRNESLVYFGQSVDAEPALAFLAERNATRPDDRPITFFHLVLRAISQALFERPRLNRFVAGGRLWQRDGVWITFSAKKAFDDDSPILTVKRLFDPADSLEEMVDGIHERLGAGRSGRKTTSDREMDLLLRLPTPLVRLAVAAARGADALGLLPRSMIDADPLFASAFVANLGSVGLDAGYHHLWEYGNCPIFCVIGKIAPGPGGGRRVALKWTYDERVEDGLYCARGLERLHERLEHPEKL
jgi:hypothetical protein